MGLTQFVEDGSERWATLQDLVDEADGRPERLGPERLTQLGRLHRSAMADLAHARRRHPSEAVTVRLEQLLTSSRSLVYQSPRAERTMGDFVRRRYWHQVRSRPWALLWAALALFGPFVFVAFWADANTIAAARVLPPEVSNGSTNLDANGDLGLGVLDQAAFAATIFVNNIKVGFIVFAGGITLGIFSAVALVFNGYSFGLLTGFAVGTGAGARLFELTLPHGVLELSLIVVAGAAGFNLGWAAIEPGELPRATSLLLEARDSVEIVLGTAFWLVIAGLIEGFVTPRAIGIPAALAVGFGAAAVFWLLVVLLGRPLDADDAELAAAKRVDAVLIRSV